MGTIVCKKCDKIIAPMTSDKSEIIYGVCSDCMTDSQKDKK